MTKEELEKEAEAFVSEKADKGNFDVEKFGKAYFSESSMKQALVKFAEPKEKQIQIDAEQIRALQKQNGELTDELKALQESIKDYGAGCYENGLRNGKRKLEEQIEKMKCCANCVFSESDRLNGTFCHKEGCFVLASAKCKLWEN
jgi:hypothetical protein